MRRQVSLILSVFTLGVFLMSLSGCNPFAKKDDKIQINGSVVESGSGAGLEGVEILALNEVIGVTGPDGKYAIHLTLGKASSSVTMKIEGVGVYQSTIPTTEGQATLPLKFSKSGYKEVVRTVGLTTSPQNLSEILMELTQEVIEVSIYREGETTGPPTSRERTPIPFAPIDYALDDDDFKTAPQPTNEAGTSELSIPKTVTRVKIKIEDAPGDNWVLDDKEKTVQIEPGIRKSVEFRFHEIRNRTVNVTCIEAGTGKRISNARVVIDKTAESTRNSGLASLSVSGRPGRDFTISCTHPKYYGGRNSVQIKEGIDLYPVTVEMRPKTFLTTIVTDSTGKPAAGIAVHADRSRLGSTNTRGRVPRRTVSSLPSASSVRINDSRYEQVGGARITRPKPDEAYEYQLDINVRFKPQTVTLTTVDAASGREIEVNAAILLDVAGTRIDPPPTVRGGTVTVKVTHLTQRIRLEKRRYQSVTVSATPSRTIRLTREAFRVFVQVKNQKGQPVEADIKLGNSPSRRSTDFVSGIPYPEGRYDITVTSDEENGSATRRYAGLRGVAKQNAVRQYAEWKRYGVEIRPNRSDGDFLLEVTLMDNYLGRARAETMLKAPSEAAKAYKQYITTAKALASKNQFNMRAPEYIEAHFELGRVYGRDLKDREAAIEQFKEVVRLQGNNADAYYYLGFYTYLQGKLEDAHKAFQNAIANETRIGSRGTLSRLKYYYADTCYRLYRENPQSKYQTDAEQYCEKFRDDHPKLDPAGDSDIREFQEELNRIYLALTKKPLY